MTKEELQIHLDEYLLKLDKQEKASNTMKKYKHHVGAFIGFMKDGQELKERTAREFKELLLQEDIFNVNTINQYIISINKFLRYCDLNDYVTLKEETQRKHSLDEVLEPAEYLRLLEYARKSKDYDCYYMMKIFAETGIRREELKFFTVENLNKKSNRFVMEVKNKGKHRKIYVPQELSRDLRAYASSKEIEQGTIFPGRNGISIVSNSTIHRHFKKVAGDAKVKLTKVHPHAFRHLFARSYLDENPSDIVGLAALLGHSKTETTEIYVMTTDDEKRRRLEKVSYKKNAEDVSELDSFKQGIVSAAETILYETDDVETVLTILDENSISVNELSKRAVRKINKRLENKHD